MNTKKASLLLLATGLALSLAACGGKKPAESSQTTESGMSVPAAEAGKTSPSSEKGGSEVDAKLAELHDQENAIFSKDQELWDKLFLSANKNSGMISDGTNYGDFLLQTIESAKDKFTEAELKTLKAGAEEIRAIEEKILALEKEAPKDKKGGNSGAKQGAATPFPDFTGKDLDGNNVDSGIFRQHAVTVINFWFSTCNPCVGELGDLDALHKQLKDKDGIVVGVNSFTLDGNKDAIAEAKSILQKKNATYPNITFASDSEAGKFVKNIMAFPTTVVVDRDGNIVGDPILGSVAEGSGKKALEERIEQALKNDANKDAAYKENTKK
ncbi:TlpA disulfide reductase family protein [Murdochiella vaginalis]|uniref:TlpA disulfide reductase family protein n=1 Tax=Murdochiella vaginalis TaxID=1852373 RepID=UPI0008FE881C|nr:TlpA disulfide reductase family protein [Murdochiella vaginalis]